MLVEAFKNGVVWFCKLVFSNVLSITKTKSPDIPQKADSKVRLQRLVKFNTSAVWEFIFGSARILAIITEMVKIA